MIGLKMELLPQSGCKISSRFNSLYAPEGYRVMRVGCHTPRHISQFLFLSLDGGLQRELFPDFDCGLRLLGVMTNMYRGVEWRQSALIEYSNNLLV